MKENADYYKDLFERYKNDDLSPGEIPRLFDFIGENPDALALFINEEKDRQIFEHLLQNAEIAETISDRMRTRLMKEIHEKENIETDSVTAPMHKTIFVRFGWAAAAILVMALVFWWKKDYIVPSQDLSQTIINEEINTPDAQVGGDAILTLADGRQIPVMTDKNGVIAFQGTSAIKLEGGFLKYDNTQDKKNSQRLTFNTISTSKGKNFKMILPDNTFAWLNAESSITYPTDFTDQERRIKISGEVYLEVVSMADKPFIVEVGKEREIEVLGTRFNINSYDDEQNVKTTLFEGAVKVKAGSKTLSLSPGQQAEINFDNHLLLHSKVNLHQVMAWRNGAFSFDNTELQAVMRELSRWYDIDVAYKGRIPDVKFDGEIGKSLTLHQVLDVLKHARVKYMVEKNKVTILSETE